MDKGAGQTVEEQLRNLRNAVRFLAEALEGLTEEVNSKRELGAYWAGDATDKVDTKLDHD